MAKLELLKKSEVMVTEERKGKQIAVKEDNIRSLKDFYQKNIANVATPIAPEMSPVAEILNSPSNGNENLEMQKEGTNITIPEVPTAIPVSDPVVATPVTETPVTPNIIEDPVISPSGPILSPETNRIVENTVESSPVMDPIPNQFENVMGTTPVINAMPETESPVDNGASINLALENEEMDPELKAIKDRLDQVIADLDNYKKKIKKLEMEVNENLEKSREVLKDTQAAAKIMSIQQERQRQISEETGGSTIEEDPTRILQKAA